MSRIPLPIVVFVALFVVSLFAYGDSLSNGFVIWDDDSLITENTLVTEFSSTTVKGAFTSYDPELYIPLTLVTFQIEHALFGFQSFYYHFDNVVLHAWNATLLFLIFLRLGLRHWPALFLASIFLLHPLNTEAVAWASARKDVLCVFFVFSSFLAFLRWRAHDRSGDYIIAILCALLAMLSKALAIMLPAGLVLLDVFKGHRWSRSDRTRYAPFAVLSILFFIIGIFGKTENIGALTPIQTLLLAAKSAVGYLPKFLWPSSLSILYPQIAPITILSREFFLPVMICVVLAITAIAFRRRATWLTIGIGWYAVFLLPSFSNFAKSGDLYVMSDRYPYIAQIGLLLIVGKLFSILSERFAIRNLFSISAAAVLLIALGFSAHDRSRVWASSEILFRDALAKNDNSVVMHYNLGVLAYFRKNIDEADRELRRAIKLDAAYGDAYRVLARISTDRGDIAEAVRILRDGAMMQPDDIEILNDLGALLTRLGLPAEAIPFLEHAIAISPSYAEAQVNLGTAYGKVGRYEEGLRALQEAKRLRGSASL